MSLNMERVLGYLIGIVLLYVLFRYVLPFFFNLFFMVAMFVVFAFLVKYVVDWATSRFGK